MKSNSIRIRPFNVGCSFEMVLPGGKVILLDPFFAQGPFEGGFSREDVTGADYILLTHSHYDHDSDIGYFVEKFHSKVLCGHMSAEEVLKFHRIPYDNLFPLYPNSRYSFQDFALDVFQCKHNPNGGRTYDPDFDIGKEMGAEGHGRCDQLGSLESLDFMITTPNGFSVLVASGRVIWDDLFDVCRVRRPNMLLRQAGVREDGGGMKTGVQVAPEVLAELLVKYHAQLIMPFHHDVLLKRWGKEETDRYFARVAEEVKKRSPGACFVNPQAWKWYDIGIDISD